LKKKNQFAEELEKIARFFAQMHEGRGKLFLIKKLFSTFLQQMQ
jgi:hypothetical protein